jgi:16S rRNA (guanine1207-N2)-methyltransferase
MGHYFTNENLKSEIKKHPVKILDANFIFNTDHGVFSKDGLDFGTRLLIESIPISEISGNVLDLGCGYGPIGISIAKLTSAKVDMIDINKRAVHLAKMNIIENKVSADAFVSDGYSEVNNKYDYIITNPPIRIGKVNLYNLLIGAKDYLKENGIIYLVIRKEQGANSLISDMKKHYNVSILVKKKGFFITCLKMC